MIAQLHFPVRTARLAKRALVLLAGVVAVYGMIALFGNGALPGPAAAAPLPTVPTRAFSRGKMATFVFRKTPKKLPKAVFRDADDKERTLDDWRGKVVLLNLWATWCAPCRKEMPSLDRLNREFGGDDFELVAVSVDRKGPAVAQAFLDEMKIETLKLYIDKTMKIARSLRAFGLPYTFLIDREGRELGRLVGPAEWDADEAKKLIKAAIEGTLSNQQLPPGQ